MEATTYNPDGWVLLRFQSDFSDEEIYKVFCSWRSGYAFGTTWRMSSGSDTLPTVVDGDEPIAWPQSSGSIYYLSKQSEGELTANNASLLEDLMEYSESNGWTVSRVQLLS